MNGHTPFQAATLLVVFTVFGMGGMSVAEEPMNQEEAVIDIETHRQLFIDDHIVGSRERVTRCLHRFKRHGGPLIVPDRPWDRADFIYGTALRDPQDGMFRMWVCNGGARPHAALDRAYGVQVAYFTSKDGLTWERPNLGLVEINGSKQNNVVAAGAGGGYIRGVSVVHNANAKDLGRRYVHLCQGPKGTSPSYSADGIHWSEDESPVFEASDAASLAYDPRQDRFFCFSVSLPEVRGFLRRSIAMTETDLKTWQEFETVLVADEIDDADTPSRVERLRSIIDYDNPDHYHAQLHHMVAFPYASINLGIVTLWDNTWYTDQEPLFAGGRDRAVLHTQLVFSRDPDWKEWHRTELRIPLIELSEPGEWDCALQSPMHGPVVMGDELWLYYAGHSTTFNGPRGEGDGLPVGAKAPANGIGLATMRLDGFASLDATPRGGTMTTKPLTFRGTTLILNARAMGHVTVELLDMEGKPVEDFGPASIAGDSVRHELTWSGIEKLAGRPVRLRFRMWNAQLYAFGFKE